MKILHLYKDCYPVLGGIENHIKVLAEAQVAAGHEVTVLVCAPGLWTRSETRNGVHVIKAGRLATAASMPLSVAQPLILTRLRPDVVHVHSPYPLGEVSAWALKARTPLVITHHSDVVRQKRILRFYGPILRRVLFAADRIVATSPRYIETSPWLGPVRDKCTVVPLGVDVTRFQPVQRSRSGPLQILFVGRLRHYKGLDTLLYAMPHVPEARLSVVGDGPMRGVWESQALELGLSDRVTFVGDVDDADLPGWYQRADLFVLPANARAEAFGTVLIEAMATGLPCVTTELGTGTSWVVQDGRTGFVVPPMDSPALAEAVQRMQDPSVRRQMGEASYETVQELFTQERMIAGVLHVYQAALQRRR
jgi:glycosyltransferase involved in cell wall biosynthesis